MMCLALAFTLFGSITHGFVVSPPLIRCSSRSSVTDPLAIARQATSVANLKMAMPTPPDRRQIVSGIASFAFATLFSEKKAHAFGTGEREIGEIPASGLIFKDTIKVSAFKDPKVEGVELYVSDFQRPITERIQKDFFSDPSYASIACARTSNVVKVSKDIYKGKDGEEVFEQARSLLFKSLRVRRLYDADTKTLVYVSYSTRLNKDDDANKSRFKSATCAIHFDEEE